MLILINYMSANSDGINSGGSAGSDYAKIILHTAVNTLAFIIILPVLVFAAVFGAAPNIASGLYESAGHIRGAVFYSKIYSDKFDADDKEYLYALDRYIMLMVSADDGKLAILEQGKYTEAIYSKLNELLIASGSAEYFEMIDERIQSRTNREYHAYVADYRGYLVCKRLLAGLCLEADDIDIVIGAAIDEMADRSIKPGTGTHLMLTAYLDALCLRAGTLKEAGKLTEDSVEYRELLRAADRTDGAGRQCVQNFMTVIGDSAGAFENLAAAYTLRGLCLAFTKAFSLIEPHTPGGAYDYWRTEYAGSVILYNEILSEYKSM